MQENMPGGRARADRNEMDGQHHNLDRTGYGGATEIGGEQTGMEECFAERVQPSDRGWIRTEQNLGFKLPSGLPGCRLLVEHRPAVSNRIKCISWT